VRVTVSAAGFDGGMPKRRDQSQPALRRDFVSSSSATASSPLSMSGARSGSGDPVRSTAEPTTNTPPSREPVTVGVPQATTSEPRKAPRPIAFDDADELDIPDFLK
jgi:cell division protein FtsZ